MTDTRLLQGGVYSLTSAESSSTLYQTKATQVGAYAIGSGVAATVSTLQTGSYALASAESSSTLYQTKAFQVGLYAIVSGIYEPKNLRAWTFTQDDHDFYVLQLGKNRSTLVYDLLSEQWAEWKSPQQAYWRGADGTDWEGYNLCCDPLSGKVYKIDPVGRLDYGTTPIVSTIYGGMSVNFRTIHPCFMGELAISEGIPPLGIDPTTVGIQLRVGNTLGWVNAGTVAGAATGIMVYPRWYGLGLMQSPGVLFELTDTGYARRIDGFKIEVGASNG